MSIQAITVNSVLGMMRTALLTEINPVELRDKVHSACELMPAPPKNSEYKADTIAGVPVFWVSAPKSNPKRVLMYLHGGGYFLGSTMTTHKDLMWRLADEGQTMVLSVDYRLSPEVAYPGAVDDVMMVYRWLLDNYDAKSLAIAGDSAGGGLTLGATLRIRDEGLKLPAAVVGLSPWTDLQCTGETLTTNLAKDRMIPGDRVHEAAEFYLQGQDATIPYASPLHGELHGLPPMLIQVGSEEVLLDDSRRFTEKLEKAGVPVVLDIWDKMPHVWQVLSMILPEGKLAVQRIGVFLRGHMRSSTK